MKTLALDLATTTGWAFHMPGMSDPHFGHFKLRGRPGQVGRQMNQLLEFIQETANTYGGINQIVFEAQHVAAKMNIDTIYMLICLGGTCELYAQWAGPQCQAWKVHISEWRKHFLGRGGHFMDKGQPIDAKELAIRRCADYGWHTNVADAAEACGILDYFLSLHPKYVRPWRDRILLSGD